MYILHVFDESARCAYAPEGLCASMRISCLITLVILLEKIIKIIVDKCRF